MAQSGGVNAGAAERTAAVLRISDHVHFVRMDDQVIVADMRSGRYLGLDDVGARVWELIRKGAAGEAIVDCLSGEYDVPRGVLERDLQRLFPDLLERRLVEYAPPG